MTPGPRRIGNGTRIAPEQTVSFRFDGRRMQGLAGDTLASALLANGIRLTARSFKYHRPRGIVTAGPDEPAALVDVLTAAGRAPNRLATTLALVDGLEVESVNRWPSLRFDALALNGLVSRFLPAGFYYKTFMGPGRVWEALFEPLIRRAAGLGRLQAPERDHPLPAETVHDHTDVLVIGAGIAGLTAASRLALAGARVMLVDQDAQLDDLTGYDPQWAAWAQDRLAALRASATARCLPRTAAFGAYGHGVFGALETLSPTEATTFGGMTERLHIIRARQVVIATGAAERLIAFADNDRPGVMLAGAALRYFRRYGVAVGGNPALFANNDLAYEAIFALQAAGIGIAGVIDPRARSLAVDRARSLGIPVLTQSVVERVQGRDAVTAIAIRNEADGTRQSLATDCLLVSGGHAPAATLATHLGAPPHWDETIAAFVADLDPAHGQIAGAARGVFGSATAAADGARAAEEVAARLGLALAPDTQALPSDAAATPLKPLWEVRGPGRAFVDLQNDVTTDDIRLAEREGYDHVEHMKRYTTHGMATDQGRIGGLVGSAVLAQARGIAVAEVGLSKPRPFIQPVSFQALAGAETGAHFKPKRRLPLHDWHEAAGATFALTGLWLRPLVYSKASGWDPVLAEARAVRRSVGITDVSTLGKIDVQGPDAARFLDVVYANTFSTLPIGRARYGIMLRDDGMMLDDGTTSRLGDTHYLVTTTTANGSAILEHLEFHLQTTCAGMDVVLTDVGDHWAQFAIAGPRARDVIARVVTGIDLTNTAFPFMAASAATIAGCAGRLFRISFSGELAYEVAVPARHALVVWEALLDAGKGFGIRAYGLDALNTLRIEKGHVTGGELNGNTTADDLGFSKMLKKNGDFLGRMMARRHGLAAPDRLQLVGIRPVEPSRRLRNGAHLIAPGASSTSLGYVTASTPGAEIDGWVGLALVAGGRARIGTTLLAASPIHGETTEVAILSPHMLDPENARVRA